MKWPFSGRRTSVWTAMLGIAAFLGAASGVGADPPAVRDTMSQGIAVPESAPLYGIWEADISTDEVFDDPFDIAHQGYRAKITCPDETEEWVCAFWYQDHNRWLEGGWREHLDPRGRPHFKLRYCPRQLGTHIYELHLYRDPDYTPVANGCFESVPSSLKGQLRMSPLDHLKVEHHNGDAFTGVGLNFPFPDASGTFQYDDLYPKMGQAGVNFSRVMFSGWDELYIQDVDTFPDFDLAICWRVDYMFSLAQSLGIHLMLELEHVRLLRDTPPMHGWEDSYWNVVNGGPCEEPRDFYELEEAKEQYRRRVRYCLARWGAFSNVGILSSLNEGDVPEKSWNYWGAIRSWHLEMADWIHSYDIYNRLVCPSFAASDGHASLDYEPNFDLVQTHCYWPHEFAAEHAYMTTRKMSEGDKPHFIGETGPGTARIETETAHAIDTEGVHIHNSMWATAMSGSIGTSLSWHWDDYIDENDLYYHYAAMTMFLEGEDLRGAATPIQIGERHGDPPPDIYGDRTIAPSRSTYGYANWNKPVFFDVDEEGTLTPIGDSFMPNLLHGVNGPHNPVTYYTCFERDGRYAISVGKVSGNGGAHLQVRVDGEVVFDQDFPDTDPDSNADMYDYFGVYRADIPAGEHTIVVDNIGANYCRAWMAFEECVTHVKPNLNFYGLQSSDRAYVWVQNRDHTYDALFRGATVQAVPASTFEILGLDDGPYRVEVHDTYAGGVVTSYAAVCTGGLLEVHLPQIDADVAVKARPLHSPCDGT